MFFFFYGVFSGRNPTFAFSRAAVGGMRVVFCLVGILFVLATMRGAAFRVEIGT